ncbi:MAG: hypothetical protein MZV70_44660 [Desulfobacterales bacterium]|nr:hypothetical protein [Desulfobacterales bacterium]
MVIGAGIAGMRASLDLANSGFQGLLGRQAAHRGRYDVAAGQDPFPPTLCHVSDLA